MFRKTKGLTSIDGESGTRPGRSIHSRRGEVAPDQEFYKALLDNLYDGVYFLDTDRRITYWNQGAERITGYRADEVVGLKCADNILVHSGCDGRNLCSCDRCPAVQVFGSGDTLEKQMIVRHRDGHQIPVLTRVAPIRDGDGRIIGAVEVFSDHSSAVAMQEEIEILREAALLDTLTGVGNRRFGEKAIRDRLCEFERYGWSFGILFADVDEFKRVNDRHGHDVGDEILRMVAKTLSRNVRSFDSVSRWGGDEFLVVLKNVSEADLLANGEKLRRLVQFSNWTTDAGRVQVTVSIGATVARVGETPELLLRRADRLLYESKKRGRNRVSAALVQTVA